MRVIFTGQMGIGKEKILKQFGVSVLNHLRQTGSVLSSDILSIDKAENHVAYSKTAKRGWIETSDAEVQVQQWEKGFRNGLLKIDGSNSKNVFLCLHAVFYKNSRYFSPFDWSLIRDFGPDLFITFIDDVIDIWWRLNRDYNRTSIEEYKLRDIMAWRSAEIMVTNMLARNLYEDKQCPHYVIAVKHPLITLQRLILEPETLRVYSAYPITDAKKAIKDSNIDQAIIREINENRGKLHKKYITFDPITIDEYDLKDILSDWKKNKTESGLTFTRKINRWSVKSELCNFPLLSDSIDYPEKIENIDPIQVDDIVKEMSHQILWRDFSLLDKVHCMAAYRPFFNEGSTGVQNELLYSDLKQLASYQYWPLKDGEIIKPFVDTGIIVTDKNEFYSLISEHQEEVRNDPNTYSHNARFEV